MPKHLYLPEVDGNISEPPTAGTWHDNGRKALRAVGDGIVLASDAVSRGVSSVPDVWARPLLFQSALRPGSKHPLRAQLLQEWRGLLSLLALQELRPYELTVAPVALDGGTFANALRRLCPAPVRLERGRGSHDGAYEWTDVLLVRCEGIPVGAFSPTTLVYTGADYAPRLRAAERVELKDANGLLAPPGPDRPQDLLYVASWVAQLQSRLNGRDGALAAVLDTGADDETAKAAITAINALLDEWLASMRADLGLRPTDRIEAHAVELASELKEVQPPASFLGSYRVYQELLRPLRQKAGGGGPPSAMLLNGQRQNGRYAALVLVTPHLLQTNDEVWASRRLANLGSDAAAAIDRHFAAASGTTLDGADLWKSHNAAWVRPELYFLTDTLAAGEDGAPLLADAGWQELNGTVNETRHLLLPFRREILDYFSPTDVRDLLRPKFIPDRSGGITFEFTLPVVGRAEGERVRRTYRDGARGPGEGRIVNAALPAAQLFPRYLGSTWRRYYLFHADADRVTLDPVVGRAGEAPARAERTHAAAESRAGGFVRAVQLTGDDPFPEALTVAAAGRAGEALGLVLVPRPAEPPGLAGQWFVGIDFGTSNTNVFRQGRGFDTAKPWRFAFDQYLLDVTPNRPGGGRAALEEWFVPATGVDLPIPTFLRVFEESQRDHPLLDYFIYFPRAGSYRLPRNLHTSIKWENEQGQNTGAFLESLLLLLLVEVAAQRVKTIDVACSYPKAFTALQIDHFKSKWERALKRLLVDDPVLHARYRGGGWAADEGASGVPPAARLEVVGPAFEVEGIAAGEFFASEKTIPNVRDRADKSLVAVCLDVGGGTTDISIWHRNAIVFDASVLLAGRDIARLLQANLRVARVLFSDAALQALSERENDAEQFAACLNVVLRDKKEDDRIREMLSERWNSPELKWLRRMLAVHFGAVAFYTGALLGAANERLSGQVAEEVREHGVTLHWGGNAAKFVNWIDSGRPSEDGVASQLLNALLFNSLGDVGIELDEVPPAQKQSPGHKSEAAGGLVVIRSTRDLRASANNRAVTASPKGMYGMKPAMDEEDGGVFRGAGIISGENIELTTGPVGHLGALTEQSLFDQHQTRFVRTRGERLARFVEVINYFAVEFGLLTDDTRIVLDGHRSYHTEITKRVRGRFRHAETLGAGHRLVEPVFVQEVKLLLELLRTDSDLL